MMYGRSLRIPVGIDLNCTHHKSISTGIVTGVATPLHLGSSVTTHEIVISGHQGERICTARLTCVLRDARRMKRPEKPSQAS
jgi:uncharacterized protein (TIGR00369 family)